MVFDRSTRLNGSYCLETHNVKLFQVCRLPVESCVWNINPSEIILKEMSLLARISGVIDLIHV